MRNYVIGVPGNRGAATAERAMRVRFLLLSVAALILVACGAGAGTTASGSPPQGSVPHVIAVDSKLLDTTGATDLPQIGQPAPDFEYTLSDGTTHKLSDLHGKKVLVNFWATWCAPCLEEMPALQKSLQSYGDTVVILGVNKLEQAAVIGPFADQHQISFPLIANPAGDISDRYGAKNIPVSYFINSDGTIGFQRIGLMPYDFMILHLDQLK
jgi:peroxiredoxin